MDVRNVRHLLRDCSSTPKSTALATADAEDQDGVGFYKDCRGDRLLPSSDGKVPIVEESKAERKLSRQELRFYRRSMDLLRRLQDYHSRDSCHVFQAHVENLQVQQQYFLSKIQGSLVSRGFTNARAKSDNADAFLAILILHQAGCSSAAMEGFSHVCDGGRSVAAQLN